MKFLRPRKVLAPLILLIPLIWLIELTFVGTLFPQENAKYSQLIRQIQTRQNEYRRKYTAAFSESAKSTILEESRKFVFASLVEKVFPAWLGTPWDFYGTTEIPRKGRIACGYFVTTTLQHCGFNLQRARLAQQPSEKIIQSLTPETNIKRYSNIPVKNFVADVLRMGKGLYIVGLDCHVGFLVSDGRDLFFYHSSYVPPYAVVRERAVESIPIISSRYRVVGKIIGMGGMGMRGMRGNDSLMVKWLTKTPIVTLVANGR